MSSKDRRNSQEISIVGSAFVPANEPVIVGAAFCTEPAKTKETAGFDSNSADPIESLIAMLIAFGSQGKHPTNKTLQTLFHQLTKQLAESWDEEKRAKTLYFALRLKPYGFKLTDEVLEALSQEPTNPPAKAWYILAQREMGKSSHLSYLPPSDGAKYVSWKMGYADKPPSGKWSLVP